MKGLKYSSKNITSYSIVPFCAASFAYVLMILIQSNRIAKPATINATLGKFCNIFNGAKDANAISPIAFINSVKRLITLCCIVNRVKLNIIYVKFL